ncbi:MAG: hypothetical protein Q9162_004302 [Coniocarpon cinnabarinum]
MALLDQAHQHNGGQFIYEDEDDNENEIYFDSREGQPVEDSGRTQSADSGDEEQQSNLEDSVIEDMRGLEHCFEGFTSKYRLINRIGEGTFSTVYKAEDLAYNQHSNEWDYEATENRFYFSPSGRKHKRKESKHHYVAIKKIYVTSSPQRILNELELLYALRDRPAIAPLITAFRDRDQVIAILPYFRHLDFRSYFRELTPADMRVYFRSLFTGLHAVHEKGIIHRDIKPTNFLYDTNTKRGVLVDFGLAEWEGTDHSSCVCELGQEEHLYRIRNSYYQTREKILGHPKGDTRPSIRANRAGTRGFRAPEVLFKCTAQTTKLDIWSVGVILLTIICKRFPFFNSSDDIEAVIELATIFGKLKMRKAALQHGQVFETNIPTIGDRGHNLDAVIAWSLDRPTRDRHGNRVNNGLREDELAVVRFLDDLLQLDPRRRLTAEEALDHPFLREHDDDDSENEMDVLTFSSTT